MFIYRMFFVSFGILVSLMSTSCYADWMADRCLLRLQAGEIIMGEEIVNSNEREVLVYRDGAQLKTGDNFIPGEILHVALSSVKGQYMFEVENGGFVAGACDNKRTTNTNKAELEMPTESSDRNVKIVAAWSEEYGKVKLSSPFLLTTMRDKYNSEDWHKDLMVDLLEKQLSSGEGLDPLLWDWNNTESVRQIRSHMQERRDITKRRNSMWGKVMASTRTYGGNSATIIPLSLLLLLLVILALMLAYRKKFKRYFTGIRNKRSLHE